MERYKEYKDSGISWIGMVPKHWEIRRFKSFFSAANGNGFKIEHQGLESGDYPFLKVSDLNGRANVVSTANNYVTEKLVIDESYKEPDDIFPPIVRLCKSDIVNLFKKSKIQLWPTYVYPKNHISKTLYYIETL